MILIQALCSFLYAVSNNHVTQNKDNMTNFGHPRIWDTHERYYIKTTRVTIVCNSSRFCSVKANMPLQSNYYCIHVMLTM